MRFDGKKFASRIEDELRERVAGLNKKPVLVVLWAGESEASDSYVEMKKKIGERIGIKVLVKRVSANQLEKELVGAVSDLENDKQVGGVMVQLPVPGIEKSELQKIIDSIPVDRDVDGLTSENLRLIATGEQNYLPATVKAVGKIMDEAVREAGLDIEKMKVAVVGSEGAVGKPLVSQMKRFGFEIGEFDLGDDLKLSSYDVVISATGREVLIKSEMVKDGVVAIDVGFPKGDFDPEVEKKAAFFTPVPGGVGPMTVVCLMENVVSLIEES